MQAPEVFLRLSIVRFEIARSGRSLDTVLQAMAVLDVLINAHRQEHLSRSAVLFSAEFLLGFQEVKEHVDWLVAVASSEWNNQNAAATTQMTSSGI